MVGGVDCCMFGMHITLPSAWLVRAWDGWKTAASRTALLGTGHPTTPSLYWTASAAALSIAGLSNWRKLWPDTVWAAPVLRE